MFFCTENDNNAAISVGHRVKLFIRAKMRVFVICIFPIAAEQK